MKSSKCLFSKTIFTADLKRFWPFALLLLIEQVIHFPVVIYSGYGGHDLMSTTVSKLTANEFIPISVGADAVAFLFAAVMALLVYSYLYSQNQTIALHAFPVGRKALFTSNFAAGYLMLAVPQLIGFAIAIPGILNYATDGGSLILLQLVSIIADSFIFFAIAAFSVMLAGNIFAGGVIYLIVNFAWAAFKVVINMAVTGLGTGLTSFGLDDLTGYYPSPAVQLISSKLRLSEEIGNMIRRAGGNPEGRYFLTVGIFVIVAIVLTVLAYLLYKARALEVAGDMIAFGAELPVFSVIISLIGGALLSGAIGSLLSFGKLGFAAAFVIFSFLCFFAAQMVMRKNAKVFQLKQLLLWAVTCGLALALAFGLASYETNRVPRPDEVESATVNVSYDMELTEEKDLIALQGMHRQLIAYNKDNSYDPLEDNDDGTLQFIQISYTLKNGKTLNRHYYARSSLEELMAQIDSLEAAHQPKTIFEQLEGVDFVIKSCAIENFEDEEPLMLDTHELQPFWELCAADAKALSKDYRSKNRNELPFDGSYNVIFECAAKDEAARAAVIKASQISDITGVDLSIEYDEYGETDSFTVTVYNFAPDSAALKLIEDKMK